MAFQTVSRLFVALLLVIPTITAVPGNPSAWSYAHMNTKDVFEGLIFSFYRVPDTTATITVTAIVDGKQVRITHNVGTATGQSELHEQESHAHVNWFPMPIGNLDTFTVKRVEVRVANLADDVEDPKDAITYELVERSTQDVPQLAP